MRVAIGSTVLQYGRANGHIDGIGTYTQALLQCYAKQHPDEFNGFVFHGLKRKRLIGDFDDMPIPFAPNVLQSALTFMPFIGSARIDQSYDLFHATDHFIPKLRKTPVLATLMDPVPIMYPEWVSGGKTRPLKNWLFKRSAQSADHYVTISEFVVKDLVEHFRIPEEKISVIPLGVDALYFQKVAQAEKQAVLDKFKLQAGFFLFIGTLQPRKNILTLIEAFRSLPLDIQKQHPLIIAGGQGWRSDKEILALQQLEIEGLGRWLNYVSANEKLVLLQSACALVFPSLYEGFGLPVLEAFASNLPVVTSNTTSLSEVAGDAAWLVDPCSPSAIAQAMQTLVESPEIANNLRIKGMQRAQEYTWQRTADATWALYEKILGKAN
ncbi:Glycogen synthase [Ephemeroptericola cinctiostellae]|uniref:Glycogen synthase n=1 Tax=Ephemeroptericola cinctiostellae TaxID=2268024 RepID=A0A345DA22_9BURK|nr:glycosyltransferase family 1 protein [Ephemeroptericola cinctiostellae]AXF85210.1 Glycogen synthase [Ephemeroptericola cinctiostellae]